MRARAKPVGCLLYTSHIYQKVGVHAQQELIDLVEERLRLMR